MNIFFIGSSGVLSLLPFQTLLASQHSIVAVGVNKPVVFGNNTSCGKIIALENESLALAANQQAIPVLDLSAPVADIIAQCESLGENLAIDVLLISCYNKRLPDDIIQLARKGSFNMHPSLLPGFRGPEPVFWQMKCASNVGVSWHQVVTELDAGDIVAQNTIYIDDGADYRSITKQLADVGAKLMLELLTSLSANTLVYTEQDAKVASYYHYPDANDFVIDTDKSAQQIYNFMRATAMFSTDYRCRIGRHIFMLDKALDYDNNRVLTAAKVQANKLYIPCKEGVLIAGYTDKIAI